VAAGVFSKMDAVIQFLAAAGPIALAIMGVAVSLRPPTPTGKAHLFWAGAFVVIGLASVVALFREIRSTDETLAELRKNTEHGPRLEFGGIKSKTSPNGAKYTTVNFYNSSDLDILSFNSQTKIYSSPTNPSETEFKEMRNDIAKLGLNRTASSLYISRGMGVSVNIPFIWDIFESNSKKNINTYLISIFVYIDKNTDINHYWATEYCAKILSKDEKNGSTEFSPCPGFNRNYYSDTKMKEVNN